MVKDGDYVAIFNSIHRVMEAERLLKEKHLKVLLIPAPRALAADCGLAIRYSEDARGEVEAALAQAGLLPPPSRPRSALALVSYHAPKRSQRL